MKARVAEAWERFWFTPEAARNLAAARIIIGAQALWILLSRDIPALSALPPELWTDVSAGARWRFLIWEGRPHLEYWLQAAALLALAAVMVGVCARMCALAAGLLLYHLAPLETLFYSPSPWAKGLTVPVLALMTLALSPCADALAPRARAPQPSSGWEYAWPLRLIQLFVCQQYLFSGWAKLRAAGLGWASAANIRAWLLMSNQDDQLALFTRPGLWIADHPALCGLMGVAALGVDLGFVAALFWRRARPVWVVVALLFHAAILVTLNYAFLSAPLLLVLVDWNRAKRVTGCSRAPSGPAAPPRSAPGGCAGAPGALP